MLLEYLPYRKLESRGRNLGLYSYFVRRGYVVARVDIRGTGQSEGRLIPYEYSDIENQDGEVGDRLARPKQPFSTGKVGMFGISWGGFNSIHMAMRRPPALKAIIAVDATDDLYQDDVHFMDGMIHVDSWEMGQDLANMMPGAPDYRIDEAYFADRFDAPPWMLTYKRAAALRALLEAHHPEGAVRRDPDPHLRDRRLLRRLSRQRPAHARAHEGAREGHHGRLAPLLSHDALSRSRRWSGATRRCAGSTSG